MKRTDFQATGLQFWGLTSLYAYWQGVMGYLNSCKWAQGSGIHIHSAGVLWSPRCAILLWESMNGGGESSSVIPSLPPTPHKHFPFFLIMPFSAASYGKYSLNCKVRKRRRKNASVCMVMYRKNNLLLQTGDLWDLQIKLYTFFCASFKVATRERRSRQLAG